MVINYAITVQNAQGQNLKNISNLISLQASRSANQIGTGTLVFPDEYLPDYWQRDMRFKIYRRAGSGPRYLLGDTVWLARKFRKSVTGKFWTINLVDALDLLGRHVVAYKQETIYSEKTVVNGNQDEADNLIKAFIRENYGSLATDTLRDLSSYITIEENKSLGQIVEKTASYQNTFDVITALANDSAERGTKLYFDMTQAASEKLIFRVMKDKLGADRTSGSAAARFGQQYKNLTDIELEYNYQDEYTVVYVGGMGQGAAQLVEEEKDNPRILKSPFGRRESYISFTDVDVDTVLESEGKAFLGKHTPRIALQAKAIDTPALQFGRNYFYGDLVKAVVDGMEFNCHVDAFSVRFENQKEDLDVRLRGDSEL